MCQPSVMPSAMRAPCRASSMPASTHAVTCSRQRAARRKTRAELYYLHQCYNRELISATVTGPWGVMHTRSRARGQPTFVWPDVLLWPVGARRGRRRDLACSVYSLEGPLGGSPVSVFSGLHGEAVGARRRCGLAHAVRISLRVRGAGSECVTSI